jgi:hypothetical protein
MENNPEDTYNDERLVSNFDKKQMAVEQQSLVFRLEERARIRRQITTRKSVQEGQPDRIADLLEEAARELRQHRDFEKMVHRMGDILE